MGPRQAEGAGTCTVAVARGGGGGERARTLGLIGVLPRVRPAEHVVDHLPLERRLRRHFALELEHIWARPAKEAHVLLILRQDGAASAWRAARVRARREAAHLEEQEVAAGRAEVHGSFATRYRCGVHASLRWGLQAERARGVWCFRVWPVAAPTKQASAERRVERDANQASCQTKRAIAELRSHSSPSRVCPWMLRAQSQ
jgi:hypothetical protein